MATREVIRPSRKMPLDRSAEWGAIGALSQGYCDLAGRVVDLEQMVRQFRLPVDFAMGVLEREQTFPAGTLELIREAETHLAAACQAQHLDDRQASLLLAKQVVAQALDVARKEGPRPLKHGLVVLRETLENVRAEKLTKAQLRALTDAAHTLTSTAVDMATVLAISRELRTAGLDYLPSVPDDFDIVAFEERLGYGEASPAR